MVAVIASCAPGPREFEPARWEYPEPEGLFAFYDVFGGNLSPLYGLVNARGEVVIPPYYYSISVLNPFDGSTPSYSVAAERFFRAARYENREDGVTRAEGNFLSGIRMALISPEGNFLTGFHYIEISHTPGNPTHIIARRADDPMRFVRLDYYGEESHIEDIQLLYAIGKHMGWLWEHDPVTRWGPDVPEQGFVWTFETRSGNFWGAAAPVDNGRNEEHLQEIRLYSPDGVLINRDVYHFVEYIGGGLYHAIIHNEERRGVFPAESYIVNQNGRRLAGPYEHFIHYSGALPFVLGLLGNNAYVMNTEDFRELRTIEIPEDGWIHFVSHKNRPLVKTASDTTPLTLILLDSGEEIVFNNFINHTLESCINENLTRFVLYAPAWEEELYNNERTLLVDRQGNILARSFIMYSPYPWGDFIVTITQTNDDYDLRMYGLLDWDGNILLEPEFTFLEVLPGNALLAARDGVSGVMDLGGNWIFNIEASPS